MKARLPKEYQGGGGNMLKQVQQMQDNMQKLQEELEAREFTATAGGGAVEVKMLGSRELTALNIDPDVIDPDDKEMLEDLVKAAINAVLTDIEKTSSDEMGKVTGGLSIPGMPGF